MRPIPLLLTVIGAVVVAWAVVHWVLPAPQLRVGPAPHTATGLTAAFYLDIDLEHKKLVARGNMDRMASDAAALLGPLKEEIALVMDEPEVVQLVVENWRADIDRSRVSLGAFADLFALVRDPLLVKPVADLLASGDPMLRWKGIKAAAVQAAPELTTPLRTAYEAARAEAPENSLNTRVDAVQAGEACGGPGLAALLHVALADPAEVVVTTALGVVRRARIAALLPDLVRLAASNSWAVRLDAAAARFALGDQSAGPVMLAALDPRQQGVSLAAGEPIASLRVPGGLEALRVCRAGAVGELARGLDIDLLRLGDAETRARLVTAAEHGAGDDELNALMVLAASADAEVIPLLVAKVPTGGSRAIAIATGVAATKGPALQAVCEALLRQSVTGTGVIHPVITDAIVVAGDAILPLAAKLLATATSEDRRVHLIGVIGSVGTARARAILVAQRAILGRLGDERIRILDLDLRRRGRVPG